MTKKSFTDWLNIIKNLAEDLGSHHEFIRQCDDLVLDLEELCEMIDKMPEMATAPREELHIWSVKIKQLTKGYCEVYQESNQQNIFHWDLAWIS
jgi:hypothetical protein